MGKIISSQNALKHGLCARDTGIEGKAYRAIYQRDYRIRNNLITGIRRG
jgi:hypothetical protein